MANDLQHEELLRQIAKLTERVYKLEQLAGLQSNEPSQKPEPASLPQHQKADLEAKIGGHWLNRIGIIAVLIGVSYFLKYAFENEWVGPAGRIVTRLLGGLGVVFWSERLRRSGYSSFSYSLKAVGVGILYLSLWASFQLYHLVPSTLAFFAMMSVTAATIALALWQDA